MWGACHGRVRSRRVDAECVPRKIARVTFSCPGKQLTLSETSEKIHEPLCPLVFSLVMGVMPSFANALFFFRNSSRLGDPLAL